MGDGKSKLLTIENSHMKDEEKGDLVSLSSIS